MKAWLIILALLVAVALARGQNSKTPINNGVLQSDLNAAGYKITNANLVDYAGTGLSWNAVTGKFDAIGGGGGTPGGSTTQFQYNNAGAFGGIGAMTYDGTIPATITLTPGASTRAVGVKLQNTAASGTQYSPSLNFVQRIGSNTYETMLIGEGGGLKVGTQTNGGGFTRFTGWDSNGNFGQILGDDVCTFAQFNALDFISMGNGTEIAALDSNQYGVLQMAGAPSFGTPRIAWSSGDRYYTGTRDTAIGRSEAGGVGIYNGPESSALGILRVATQAPGDNSTKAATTAYVAAAVAGGGAVSSVFTRTGAVVALVGDYSAFYQPLDSDLTLWAAITPGTGVGTFLATPSSANLRGAVTDENGTGAALFNGATTPDFTTGITISTAAASRKILVGDGTKFAASTETWAVPGTTGNVLTSNGTNWTSAAPGSLGAITLPAGTTTVAPLTYTSGTNLTTPVAGAIEYDGKVHYSTHAAGERGVEPSHQIVRLTSAYTLTSQTAAQKLFNSTTNGQVTVAANTTYRFNCLFTMTAMAASSSFGFALGGTATITRQGWFSSSGKIAFTGASGLFGGYFTAASTSICATGAGTTGLAKIEGTFTVTTGGTIIPQVSLGAAAAAIVGVDSYFEFWPIGSDTVQSVGNWN